ncbi:MAG: formate dehydrogenase subunit gamma [Candidatus Bipolaricaulia bacterium]
MRYYRRFKPVEVWLHVTIIISFLGLALTGLMLKFSEAGWAKVLADLLGGYRAAGALHRFLAIVTFGYFITHLVQLFGKYLRGRKKRRPLLRLGVIFGPNSMVPRWKDLVDLWDQFLWFFGLRRERPEWDRFSYFAKFDYFAVFWGVPVIGLSGLLLWFKGFFSLFLPGWLLNVAFIVHSDEALLAVGFIFGIHFFNAHLRAESFPIDLTIFTGRISEEELREKHPVYYERLKREGKLEELRCDPPPEWLVRTGKVFGFAALATGLACLGLIIWAIM